MLKLDEINSELDNEAEEVRGEVEPWDDWGCDA